jgi:O-antigen ligase
MRWLIALLVAVLVAGDVLHMGMSLAPGVSVKNLLLYWILFALLARMIVSGEWRFDLPAIHVAFVLFIAYAICSWFVAGVMVRYPRYDLVQSGIGLKGLLIDPALFFFATFYALRTKGDVLAVLKGFALAITAANFLTLTDVVGLTHFGVRVGDSGAEAGRVFGVFGHANETAGLIACLLPSVAALAVSRERGRVLWWGAALISLAVLIMTVSRGAFVAAALGTMWTLYMCRRYLPVALVLRAGALGALSVGVVLLVVVLLEPHIGATLSDRLLGQSTSMDVDEVSSGRTQIWSAAVGMMMRTPITLFTGFGWDTYAVMPFHFATHNHYLSLWFELGIPGVAALVFILAYVIVIARRALDTAGEDLRPHLIAFICGMLSLSIALMFGNMVNPWPYVWIYIGIGTRVAMLAREPERPEVPAGNGVRLRTAPALGFKRQPVKAGRLPA